MAALAAERAGAPATFTAPCARPLPVSRLWALAAIYFSVVLAIYGVSFWLPQILQALGPTSSATVALVSGDPLRRRRSGNGDRRRPFGPHRRASLARRAVGDRRGDGLRPGGGAPTSLGWSLAALSLAAMGVWSTLGPFWALPTAFLTGRAAAGGVALVNSVANIGGFVGPTLMGYLRDATGTFTAGLWLLAAAAARRRGDYPVAAAQAAGTAPPRPALALKQATRVRHHSE